MKAVKRNRTENTYKKKILPVIKKEKDNIDYVLLGHSYLERFKVGNDGYQSWVKYIEPIETKTGKKILNAGIGGDRLSNLLYLLEEEQMLDQINLPKRIILVIGANEYFIDNASVSEILDGFSQVINFITKKFPTTILDIIGFFPGKSNIKTFNGRPFDTVQYGKDALLVSAVIRTLVDNKTKFFHDFWPYFAHDELYADDVHFNKAGYDIFGRLIANIIEGGISKTID